MEPQGEGLPPNSLWEMRASADSPQPLTCLCLVPWLPEQPLQGPEKDNGRQMSLGPEQVAGQNTFIRAPPYEAGLTKDEGVSPGPAGHPCAEAAGGRVGPQGQGAPHVSRTGSWERVSIPANLLVLMVNEQVFISGFSRVQTVNKVCEKECPPPPPTHTAQGDPARPRSPPGPMFLGCFFSEAFTTCTPHHRYATTHIHAHMNMHASNMHRCCACYQNMW